MVIDISLIQNFLLALGIVSFAVILIFIVSNLVKKHKHIRSNEPDLGTGYKNLLKTANKHAKNVLTQTTIEAASIITGARATNEKLEENLDTVLQSIAKKDIETLKNTTQTQEKNYEENLKNINTELDHAAKEAIDNTLKKYNESLEQFTKSLLKNGLSTQDAVDKKTAELVTSTESEIEEYKKTQFEKIDADAKKLLEKVYKDVLKTSIPESLHQDLILKSLEEAKKEELFKL